MIFNRTITRILLNNDSNYFFFLVYIVTDRALGGDLNSRICQKGSYFERNAINIVRNIIEAVKYLHDKEIVHRSE